MDSLDIIFLAFIVSASVNAVSLLAVALIMQVRWKGRRSPMGVVSSAIRAHFTMYARIGRRRFRMTELDPYITYIDWDRGYGYGYMEEPLKLGDQIWVKARKNKSMVLLVYSVQKPDPDIPSLFIFRTFYAGMRYEPREEKFIIPKKFQRD